MVVVLLGDHECSQVGRVAGREDDGEEGPDVGEEPTRHAARVVDAHGGAEQHRPDEPEGAKQGELVLCGQARHRTDEIERTEQGELVLCWQASKASNR